MNAHRPLFTAALLVVGAALAQGSGGGPDKYPSTNPRPESTGSMTTRPGMTGTTPQQDSSKAGGEELTPPVSGALGTTPAPGMILGELHMANQAEIEMGKLAEQKAQSKEVKNFGKHMVKAHTGMDKDLQSWAKKHQVTVAPPSQDDSHQAELQKMQQTKQRLQGLSGAEFDRAYMQAMAEDHANDLNKVRTFEQEATDKSLQKLLEKARKEIAEHKKDADKLVEKLGATATR
jgi:putative membrane protein